MRRCFLMKVCLIAIHNLTGLLFGMLLSVGLFDFEWTYAISTPVKSSKYAIAPFHCHSLWPDIYSPMWNFMENLMVHSTWLHLAVQKSFVRKTSEKSNIMNIPDSNKFQDFPALLMCSFTWKVKNKIPSHRKNFEKFSEFSLNIGKTLWQP